MKTKYIKISSKVSVAFCTIFFKHSCKTNKNIEGFVPEKSQKTGESILFDEAADRLAFLLGQ
jgi:hypothetical protein